MADPLIADRIRVQRRYVRAVDIARDLPDPHALDGYILTSRASEALSRLSNGLSRTSTQRAFRITGPYGSGKSSFGLLLAKLMEETGGRAESIASSVLAKKKMPSFEPIILVGSRTSLARELVAAIGELAAQHLGYGNELSSECERLLHDSDSRNLATKRVLTQLTRLTDILNAKSGKGVLVLIDEMGRYLEYAAANPTEEDPALFQQLAERASGSANPALAVVAFLHHRFDDYLGSTDGWTSQEWARSAERYEEISFSEPREQAIYLIDNALKAEKPHSPSVRKAAAKQYKIAAANSLFAIHDNELAAMGEGLYPLHPVALSCLTMAASRFGQHERSVFSFLQSSEPAGFLHYAHNAHYGPEHWYRIDRVFDYMSSLGNLRFDSADRDRRWAMGREAVDTLVLDDEAVLRILKSVAVIATLEPLPGIKADVETLSWALDVPDDQVLNVLENLSDAGTLYRRAASKDFSLWSNSSVDLSHWYAEAERAVGRPTHLNDDLASIPALRPVIAQRHYHSSGTLRSFQPSFGEELSSLPDSVDGRIIILPVNPRDKIEERSRHAAALSEQIGPLALVHLRQITDADIDLSYQLKCWKWVADTCDELRMDDLARSEVLRNIDQLQQRLQARLSPFAFRNGGKDWYHVGRSIAIGSRASLSRKLSLICDKVFDKAPELRNELINRSKLSTAIAAARMRLLKRMIENEHKAFLGLEGAPPERAVFLSMFQSSGMHRTEGGNFGFHPPALEDGLNWHHAWERVERLVSSDEAISFEQLIEKLSTKPYGLRAGPALLLIAAVMLHHRTTIALIERGTFQPELSEAHFMRLAKNPKNFALKRVVTEKDDDLLERLSGELSIFDSRPPVPELKAMVEYMFLWWRELNEYARTTAHVTPTTKAVRLTLKKARDPIELLFRSLPEACEASSKDGIDADRYVTVLDEAFRELSDALPTLRSRVAEHLRLAFGARSLEKLREQLRVDYADHLLHLGDYKLRAFIDRAMNQDLSAELWLDRVASLLVGKRLESWDDTHLDQFCFEVNTIAQELARRLAILRKNAASTAPITAIHITTSSGEDRSYFIHEGSGADTRAAAKLRKALKNTERPEAVLIDLLRSMLAKNDKEKTG